MDQTNIVPGSNVSFSVTATGTAPLSYQWQKDGVDLTDGGSITGATTATLTITDVMESDEVDYSCVVTNIAGMDTSNTATLTFGKLKPLLLKHDTCWVKIFSKHFVQCYFIHIHTYICDIVCLELRIVVFLTIAVIKPWCACIARAYSILQGHRHQYGRYGHGRTTFSTEQRAKPW